ncbi:hypothetical protein BDW59DRAFT_167587 [Aspergillus cavernicola]|uniref:Uncharacterized protein n=1 Tax=Aspergillus cavernicola TaxID=176166 RepID=A0ABR4HCK1_9EURO
MSGWWLATGRNALFVWISVLTLVYYRRQLAPSPRGLRGSYAEQLQIRGEPTHARRCQLAPTHPAPTRRGGDPRAAAAPGMVLPGRLICRGRCPRDQLANWYQPVAVTKSTANYPGWCLPGTYCVGVDGPGTKPQRHSPVTPSNSANWHQLSIQHPAPSKHVALPGLLMGMQQGYLTAYTTRLVTSVVCGGFVPAPGDIAIRHPAPRALLPGDHCQPAEVQGPGAYSYPTTTCGATSPRSGTDSDLEGFSHYPADGSVAALPGQTAAKTNYLNQRFLSY